MKNKSTPSEAHDCGKSRIPALLAAIALGVASLAGCGPSQSASQDLPEQSIAPTPTIERGSTTPIAMPADPVTSSAPLVSPDLPAQYEAVVGRAIPDFVADLRESASYGDADAIVARCGTMLTTLNLAAQIEATGDAEFDALWEQNITMAQGVVEGCAKYELGDEEALKALSFWMDASSDLVFDLRTNFPW